MSNHDILQLMGIKPYMIQYKDNYWTDHWECKYDLQFNTLEEAQAALEKCRPSRGPGCYRIAEAYATIQYRGL